MGVSLIKFKIWQVLNKMMIYMLMTIWRIDFFEFPKIIPIFDPTNQIFLPVGCLVFIKKGEEIRLCETLATNPAILENGAKT
jgi:hypothetical protein